MQQGNEETASVSPSPDEVEQTIRAAKALDGEALARLHGWVFPSIYRYCATRSRTVDDAEDLTEEVFLEIVEGIQKLRADNLSSLHAWVLRIAHNKVADYYRRGPVLRETSLTPEMDRPDEAQGPEERALANQERADLRRALEQLTPEQRDVVLCKYVLGYGNEMTAQMLKKTANAVNALQYRALASLKKLLVGGGSYG